MDKRDMRFKVARIEKNLSQQDLAVAAGVSEHVISKIETGRLTPSREIKEVLARMLGKQAYELFGN